MKDNLRKSNLTLSISRSMLWLSVLSNIYPNQHLWSQKKLVNNASWLSSSQQQLNSWKVEDVEYINHSKFIHKNQVIIIDFNRRTLRISVLITRLNSTIILIKSLAIIFKNEITREDGRIVLSQRLLHQSSIKLYEIQKLYEYLEFYRFIEH